VTRSVEPIAVHGEWVRHAPHRAALLGRSRIPTSGRWQRAGAVLGLYLADDQTAVAEWYRWLAERAMPPARAIPHDHHRWHVELDVADLSTAERLAEVGLPAPQPSQGSWPAFQTVGERLLREGWRGVLAPSAARPGSLMLCVFCTRWPPAGCAPVDAQEIGDVPPPPVGMTT
jgi:RES domain-containing protein